MSDTAEPRKLCFGNPPAPLNLNALSGQVLFKHPPTISSQLTLRRPPIHATRRQLFLRNLELHVQLVVSVFNVHKAGLRFRDHQHAFRTQARVDRVHPDNLLAARTSSQPIFARCLPNSPRTCSRRASSTLASRLSQIAFKRIHRLDRATQCRVHGAQVVQHLPRWSKPIRALEFCRSVRKPLLFEGSRARVEMARGIRSNTVTHERKRENGETRSDEHVGVTHCHL